MNLIQVEAAPESGSQVRPRPALADEIASDHSTERVSTSRPVWSLTFIGANCAVLAGVVAWLLPAVWDTDPSSDAEFRAILGFCVLLLEVFAFHGGLLLLVGSVAASVVGLRRHAVLLAILGLVHAGPGLFSMVPGFQRTVLSENDRGASLSVLSHNLLFSTASLDALSEIVDHENPDVIMLQEVVGVRAHEIIDRFGAQYPHRVWPDTHSWGAMLLSKHKFIETPDPILGQPGWPIDQPAGVVEFEGQRIALVAVHLPAPNHLDHLVAGPQMSARLGSWIEDRVGTGSDGAMILAGDFNAPLWTARMEPLRDVGLRRAHDMAGVGRGATWPDRSPLRFAPGIRLDQAAFVGDLRCVESRVIESTGSDHRPIFARFVWADEG